MFELVLVCSMLAIVAGVIAKVALKYYRSEYSITWVEFVVGSVLIVLFIAPITGCVGWNAAKANARQYNEYWNGWETAAVDNHITCTTNGSCHYTYDCNCHQVTTCVARDDKGNCTQEETHTECDSCPYFVYERSLSIMTTLGEYDVGRFAPEDYRQYMKTSRLPRGFGPEDYTPPQLWLDCKARIEAGQPGPVTKRMTYENFILASDQTILKQYSDQIERFKNEKLLPPLQRGIASKYYANKVYFVGYQPENTEAWQRTLSYLNAGLGTELQGDLHLVLAQNDTINANPDAFLFALKAYWQNPDEWGKDSLSKNTILVLVGTSDGTTVSWARAITGMPGGNELLLVTARNDLAGTLLTPDELIGSVQGEFYQETKDGKTKTKVRSLHKTGALERLLWGLDDPSTKFVRVSMTARDKTDVGNGYLYLDSEIEPSTGAKVGIGFLIFFLSMIVWAVAIAVGTSNRERIPLYRSARRSWRNMD